jgi:hypothetical protein
MTPLLAQLLWCVVGMALGLFFWSRGRLDMAVRFFAASGRVRDIVYCRIPWTPLGLVDRGYTACPDCRVHGTLGCLQLLRIHHGSSEVCELGGHYSY